MAKKKKKSSLDKVTDSNKEILFDILSENKIKMVEVMFDGSSDDGQIEGSDLPEKVKRIVVKGSKINDGVVYSQDGSIHRWKENCTVEEIIDSICYEALESVASGWEIGDGAHGTLLFDVEKRSIELEYNERYVEERLREFKF